MSERSEDRADAGFDRDVGEGYPEENQPGTSSGEHAAERPGQGDDTPDAPDTRSEQESEPGAATGNPKAAGG